MTTRQDGFKVHFQMRPPIKSPGHAGEDWTCGPSQPCAEPGAVHIWRIDLELPEAALARWRAFLSDAEAARADHFLRQRHGRRFTVAHGALRSILASYIHRDPRRIAFRENDHGKPFLAGAAAPGGLEFNLSHTGDVALVAVTRDRLIGVDVERYRDRLEAEKIARRHFSPREVSRLFALPEAEREEAFYACWSRKEAYIKARGEGIALGLDRFDVAFERGRPPALLWSHEGEQEVARWDFVALNAGERLAAACVVEGPIEQLSCWSMAEI